MGSHGEQGGPPEEVRDWRRITLLAVLPALLGTGYWVLIASGTAHVTLWLNDVMTLIAGSYRVSQGQLPSLDLFSGYGAIIYYPSAVALGMMLMAVEIRAFLARGADLSRRWPRAICG